MSEQITLENGLAFSGYALVSTDLFLYLYSTDMLSAFDALIAPENTWEIIYTQANGESVTYTGFTKLIAVRDEDNGLITAVLRKGVTTDV